VHDGAGIGNTESEMDAKFKSRYMNKNVFFLFGPFWGIRFYADFKTTAKN
jgi:hypothetical protein